MSGRNEALSAVVEGDRLVMSIGVDALKAAIEGGQDWAQHSARITDADAFAQSMASALMEKEDDGQTELTFALDRAADWVIESGDPGVETD